MMIDWDQYRIECAQQRRPVLERFGKQLLDGASMATVQSAPAYTGALTAVLVTLLRQMTDLLRQYHTGEDTERISDGRTVNRDGIRKAMKERYFGCLSGISRLEIAKEYARVHFHYQDPQPEAVAAWLFSFQGKSGEIESLVRKMDEVTDRFIREDVPRILMEQYGN